MLRVVVEKGGEIVHDGVYGKRLISIGRDDDNDVVLQDPFVSAQHMIVRADADETFRLFDQSYNGTWQRGERIGALRFDRQTVVTLASFQLTLIPIRRSGTAELSLDLYAPTVVDDPSLADEAATSSHPSFRPTVETLPDAELRSISIDGELKSLVFNSQALIGRALDCDLRFESRDVSRRHCLITAGPDGYSIRRLSRKNDVEIGDRLLALGESALLRDGDVIHLCDEEIVFLCPATQPVGADTRRVLLDASPNVDLTVVRRTCFDSSVVAVDVVGFLGSKTWPKFEDQILRHLAVARRLLVDLGYLVGIDRDGIASLGRMITQAEKNGVRVQLIRVTPRIADLLSYSQLKQLLSTYISKSEETAVRRLRS